jgi:hypothetical protein
MKPRGKPWITAVNLLCTVMGVVACWFDVKYDLQPLAFLNAFVAVGNLAWALHDIRHARRR